jgi:hypothetical protein
MRGNIFNTELPYPAAFASAVNSASFRNKVGSMRYVNLDLLGGSVPAKGDVNGDGSVTLKDCTMIRYYLLGMTTLTAAQITQADMDSDGNLTLKDANMIRSSLAS